MPAKPLSDLDLVEAALEKYGGAKKLAAKLGVRGNTPNAMLKRVRDGGRLSIDKRQRLESLLASDGSTGGTVDEKLDRILGLLEEFVRGARRASPD